MRPTTDRVLSYLLPTLRALGCEVVPGVANFILCHLPDGGPDAATVVQRCRRHNLFLRDTAEMGSRLGLRALRIAVKDGATNRRMAELIRRVLTGIP